MTEKLFREYVLAIKINILKLKSELRRINQEMDEIVPRA
jgi:hypothetical protein